MTIWALADLHLAISVPEKTMDIFGDNWTNYIERIKENWNAVVSEEDLVLVAGDITWAMHLKDAKIDLEWIGELKGTKVMIKGNHDYWWSSKKKVEAILPSSVHIVQNNSYQWQDVSIGGTRLWDTQEFSFGEYYQNFNSDRKPLTEEQLNEQERIFAREVNRLELSLKSLEKNAKTKIIMTHYPPIGSDLKSSVVSNLLENYDVDICVFGHLHNLKKGRSMFGELNNIRYILTAADFLDFKPIKVLS